MDEMVRDHVLTWCFNDRIYVDFTNLLTFIGKHRGN
jgi:hypothetical protein